MQDIYEQGEALYFGEEYAEAEPLLRRAAEEGHAHAPYRLGRCYQELGRLKEAVRWLRVAAERGDPLAMNDLALCLEDGDRAEAVVWMRRAAETGSQATAGYNLGIFLEEDGNLQEAEYWYRQAVNCLYFPAARNRLALLLELTDRDDEAETWYRTALEEMAAREDPDDRDDDHEANTQIMLNLADLLERTGRPGEARDLRRHAADRH
ncbi:tetratricopeptide repeat protein [Actinomadura nitritigenes]|uniref:tetratricopeptide repeat protein n=1 Tax=Actinomadura nitritigenes TaxID=134602 RepID=UPI003D9047C3